MPPVLVSRNLNIVSDMFQSKILVNILFDFDYIGALCVLH